MLNQTVNTVSFPLMVNVILGSANDRLINSSPTIVTGIHFHLTVKVYEAEGERAQEMINSISSNHNIRHMMVNRILLFYVT
jgi:hypothetical protein